MEQTIQTRILENLKSGPKTYMELMTAEQDSAVGLKKYLTRRIQELERFKQRNSDRWHQSNDLVLFAYKEFVKEAPDDLSMNEYRRKIGRSARDFVRPTINMYFGQNLKKLLDSGKIIKIKRGLYSLNKEVV